MQLVLSLQSPVQRSSAGTTRDGKQHDVWIGSRLHVWSKGGRRGRWLVTPNLQLLRLFCIVSVRINDMGQESVPDIAATLGNNCAVNFFAVFVVMDASTLRS